MEISIRGYMDEIMDLLIIDKFSIVDLENAINKKFGNDYIIIKYDIDSLQNAPCAVNHIIISNNERHKWER